ncbi:hypothetical protein [Burkholderia sp. S171]|uniref:hypothetical protein n=1 Tax=Burkholderia sp. S171 TaxID=1641860 RepID=UPI00131DC8F3|nr:hypothetical protein [Burkholderia sp. S171]
MGQRDVHLFLKAPGFLHGLRTQWVELLITDTAIIAAASRRVSVSTIPVVGEAKILYCQTEPSRIS